MNAFVTPKGCLGCCKIAGFGLLFAYWVMSGETTGFFLLLFLVVMALLRWRIPQWKITILLDFAVCAALSAMGGMPYVIMALPLFDAMHLGYYWLVFGVAYAFYGGDELCIATFAFSVVCGYFLNRWERERKQKQTLRDAQARRYYELESLQGDLVAALAQIEQMTTVAERARIARDIHDNAGHEIVAAHMTFQAVRNMLACEDAQLRELYDEALKRLDVGTNKIREAVHNLSTVAYLGVERLREKCAGFSASPIDFKVYGDTTHVPIYVWSMLESCLNEALTNVVRHASASWVKVELDATPHIVRLCVTNDGVVEMAKQTGSGLRNLRHRAAAIGGSVSVDEGKEYGVICVIPIRANRTEGKDEAVDCR